MKFICKRCGHKVEVPPERHSPFVTCPYCGEKYVLIKGKWERDKE